MIKLKDLITEVKPGDVFQDVYKKGVEIAIEKFMGKWKTVSINVQRMTAYEVGTSPEQMLKKQKLTKLSSSDKMKIKKIVNDPQEADYINQDDSNMVKKLLRAIK